MRLLGNHGFCSQAIPGVHSKPIKFDLKGNDVKSVTFPIVPIQLGKVQVRVSVTQTLHSDFDDSSSTDTVERDLIIVVNSFGYKFILVKIEKKLKIFELGGRSKRNNVRGLGKEALKSPPICEPFLMSPPSHMKKQ